MLVFKDILTLRHCHISQNLKVLIWPFLWYWLNAQVNTRTTSYHNARLDQYSTHKKYSNFRNYSAIVFDVARFLVYFYFLVGRIGLNSFSMSGGSCDASCLQSHIQKRDPKGASLEMTIPVPIGFLAKTFNHWCHIIILRKARWTTFEVT